MTHWHDTADFDRIARDRVERHRASDVNLATHICRHGGTDYFMRGPRRDESWFLCRDCCLENVTLELLTLDDKP